MNGCTDMSKLTYRYYVGLLSFLNEEYQQVRNPPTISVSLTALVFRQMKI